MSHFVNQVHSFCHTGLRARSSSIGVVAVAAALIAIGCAPSIKTRAVPDSPIAFVYRTEPEARRRAESIADQQPDEYDPRTARENRGVVDMKEFKNYLDSAFGQKSDPKHRGRLALLDPRSADVRVIEGAQQGSVPMAWSPVRKRLLFAQGDPGGEQLYEYDLETEEVAKLTHGPNVHPQGCYMSEGRLVVAMQSVQRSGGSDWLTSRLAVRSPNGTIEVFTSGPSDGSPACSRNGEQVAFVRVFGSEPQIWEQSLKPGAAARPITPGLAPSFSPDGEWIVFGRGRDNTSKLWRIRVSGVGRTRLGLGAGAEEYRPVVSPDGQFVVYESVLEYRSRLHLRRFDGGGDVVLFSDGDGLHPIW
jgi:Tol biopolymer transport system component